MEQLRNLSALPFIHKHVACMPDVHAGYGSTVGSVIPTKKAIIPAAVGVDIGCGMMAVKLGLTADDLPDNLSGIRSAIESAVPHGRTDHGGKNDRGAWSDWDDLPEAAKIAWNTMSRGGDWYFLKEKYPDLVHDRTNTHRHLASIVTGKRLTR